MIAEIEKLIEETTRWHAEHCRRRDEPSLKAHRESAGAEALACVIRLNALRECLAIVKGK